MSTPNLETIAAAFLGYIPHMRECGLSLVRGSPEGVELRMPFREEWVGDPIRGVLHTGPITVLVDSACGLAVLAATPVPETIATLDLRMDYLRPAMRDKDLYCRAECFRLTSHIAFVRASVWQDDPGQPVAISQSAFMRSSQGKPWNPEPRS
jgi:uncharacterized protein (TIGR00369 family)